MTGATVGSLLGARGAGSGLEADLLAGSAGLDRLITLPYIQKTGLALAGFDEYLRAGRVLVFGESEIRFLEKMNADTRTGSLRRLLARDLPCVLVTGGFEAPDEMIAEAERAGVPLLRTALATPIAIARLTSHLEDQLAPREILHGVVRCRAQAMLVGACPELTRNHIEIRGLGLINVGDLFGISATRSSKRIELIVQLERWEVGREYDRLGLDIETQSMLGVKVPLIRMPVAPGRNLAMLVEVAARNQMLRSRGRHAAKLLAERLERRLETLAERDSDGTDGDEDL